MLGMIQCHAGSLSWGFKHPDFGLFRMGSRYDAWELLCGDPYLLARVAQISRSNC